MWLILEEGRHFWTFHPALRQFPVMHDSLVCQIMLIELLYLGKSISKTKGCQINSRECA